MIITIDGPVAAGKTSTARRLATRIPFSLLDTGAIYRAVALQASDADLDWHDEALMIRVAQQLAIRFHVAGEINRVVVGEVDVTEAIRRPAISRGASIVSALPGVRTALLSLQRDYASANDVIAEGRDTGTVVFPRADTKFFLTADPEVRAQRRYRELAGTGIEIDLESVRVEMEERDQRDSSREVAPLVPATDAILVDSTSMDLEQVVKTMLDHIPAALRTDP